MNNWKPVWILLFLILQLLNQIDEGATKPTRKSKNSRNYRNRKMQPTYEDIAIGPKSGSVRLNQRRLKWQELRVNSTEFLCKQMPSGRCD